MSRTLDRSQAEFEKMPTVVGDAVVESGSNADGDWIRWADGTQICHRKGLPLQASVLHGNAYAGGFRSSGGAAGVWNYPIAFSVVPKAMAAARPDSLLITGLPGADSATSVNFTSWRVTNVTVDVEVRNLVAVGRWK